MDIKQKFLNNKDEITYTQVYIDENPQYKELRDEKGNYLFDILDISNEEFVTFVQIGHRTNPTEYDEDLCFELGIITAIKRGLKHAEKENLFKEQEVQQEQTT